MSQSDKTAMTTKSGQVSKPQAPLIKNIRPSYTASGIPVLKSDDSSSKPPESKLRSTRVTVVALPSPTENEGGAARKHGLKEGMQPSPTAASSAGGVSGSESALKPKRKRGRPPGSTKKNKAEALLGGPASIGFIPEMFVVLAGEDVSSKIRSFAHNERRDVCVLSGTGALSLVTLRHPATSDGTTTYEGLFDILSLSGSFSLTEDGGHWGKTNRLSISLAGQDGRFIGGVVAGRLIAASDVQVIVGGYIGPAGEGRDATNQPKPSSSPLKFSPGGDATGTSSSTPPRGNSYGFL